MEAEQKLNGSKNYRDSTDIIYKILLEVKNDYLTKTEIMIKSGLSHPQLKSYMEFLITKQLVKLSGQKKSSGNRYNETWMITPKGIDVFNAINRLKELIA